MPRIPESIKRPGQILGSGPGALPRLFEHARMLLALQAQIRELVPGEIHVAACEDGYLHLITPSSALATRLKYNQRKIIALFRQTTGQNAIRIKVSVRPEFARPEPATRPAANPLSPENASLMASAAKYIEDDDLRKALIRLSNRASTTKSH